MLCHKETVEAAVDACEDHDLLEYLGGKADTRS